MAAQACLAVVNVTALFSMLVIHLRFFVRVTMSTGELIVVTGPMAVGTVSVVGTSNGESMIESGLVPGSMARAVTVLAGCWKSGRHMVGAPGTTVVIRVTTEAVPRQVVSLTVTSLTIEAPVGTLEAEDAAVIEGSPLPSIG